MSAARTVVEERPITTTRPINYVLSNFQSIPHVRIQKLLWRGGSLQPSALAARQPSEER
jgi:hypothetical protein